MTCTTRTTIYFKDKEILDYLNTKDNKSKYLSDLIKVEMERNKPITREEIISLIKQYAGSPSPDNSLKEEIVKDTMDKLFKIK
jgi:hypothetical protein